MKNSNFEKILNSANSFLNNNIDDIFFENALDELDAGNKNKGIWARSLALSEGDEVKARSKYIQLRAEDLYRTKVNSEDIQNEIAYKKQEEFYELNNQDQLEKALDSALNTVGGVIGIYLLLGVLAIGFSLLLFFVEFDLELLSLLLGGILLVSPYLIIKYWAKTPLTTFKDRKKRVNKMYFFTIISSAALTIVGLFVAIFLIYKLIIFNKRTVYKIE